jgi:hypothetical protein
VTDEPTIRLERWSGPWPDDDPDAGFKADIAAFSLPDPLETLRGLGENLDIPIGALARAILARWASEGSSAILELGPSMVERLWAVTEEAEQATTDEERLEIYRRLRGMVSWLRVPLTDPDGGGYSSQR